MKLRKVEVVKAFGSYRVGDVVELMNIEADFAISRGFAVLADKGMVERRKTPRKNPKKESGKTYIA